MAQHLTYRLYRDEDLPCLLRLWEEETDWGKLTPEQWRQWYVDTPHEPCMVMVAEDGNGDIVGQQVFIPSRVIVGRREVHALRLSAPILRKDLRRAALRKMDHPVVCLYEAATNAAVALGYDLVYALPDHAWLPFFRWFYRFGHTEYHCVESSITPTPRAAVSKAGYLIARAVVEFGAEYEALWQSAVETFPITLGVARSPKSLRYKNDGHVALEVRDTRDNALVGYAAIKKQTGLLTDILARNPADCTPVLAATLNWLATERSRDEHGDINRLKAMQTPALDRALRALDFVPVNYKFLFVCDPLDSSLSMETVSPERWYITPGD